MTTGDSVVFISRLLWVKYWVQGFGPKVSMRDIINHGANLYANGIFLVDEAADMSFTFKWVLVSFFMHRSILTTETTVLAEK
jgi:hypothetical protein